MKYIWSYLIVGFCMSMTSARVMEVPVNMAGLQDNSNTQLKDEGTPPPTITEINLRPGSGDSYETNSKNSNEATVENIQLEELPPFFREVLTALFNQNKQSDDYEIVPFSKEDIISMENSELCKTMCQTGVRKPPCKCE